MIHSKVSTVTSSAGSTVGTFDPVNTRNGDNILPAGCTGIYGFTLAWAENAITAAKSAQLRLRVNAANLGLNSEDFLSGWLIGSGIATNDDGSIHEAEFIPFQVEGSNFGLSTVNFSVSQAGASSGNTVGVICSPVSFTPATGPAPPAEWYMGRMNWPGRALPAQGSASSNGATFGTAANSGTSLTSTKVADRFKSITAITLTQVPAAVGTAGEEYIAWADFGGSSTTLAGVAPQEWPFNTIEPDLGTPVGTPMYGRVPPLPCYIPKAGGDVTVDALANMITAVTGAASGSFSLDLRR